MNKRNDRAAMYLSDQITVNIYHEKLYENQYYLGASVGLPATSDVIQDAMDRAGVSPGDKYKFTELMWNQHCFEGDILKGVTIEEVNFLSWRLSQMDEHYGLMYEACLRNIKKELTIKDLINLTYALDNCHVGYHINTDEELGKFAAEGDFIEELVNVPDEAWEFIDFKKLGERMRNEENGQFLEGCYVVCNIDNMEEIYDGVTLPNNPLTKSGIFNLLISKAPMGDEPTDKQAKWLYLPASANQLTKFLNEIYAESFDECVYYEFKTTIPKIKDLFIDLDQLEKLNFLAKCISNQELRKCKAVLEHMDCENIEQAIGYCENLHCFDFYPELQNPSDYGKWLYNLDKSVIKEDILKHFDFDSYGREQMILRKIEPTPYGYLSQNKSEMNFKQNDPCTQVLNDFEM